YCSGTWTASFDAEADWIRIEEGTESGEGTGVDAQKISGLQHNQRRPLQALRIEYKTEVGMLTILSDYKSSHFFPKLNTNGRIL
uniref:hypothetical protein n=1 Tax=Alistipes sp. TaxID=1872444 RepID=UPI0040564246